MSTPTEAPRAEQPTERAALAVRPCARNIHAALKRANITVKGVRVTTGGQRCKVDLTATLEEYGQERAQEAERVIRRLWNDHESRVSTLVASDCLHLLAISVRQYWRTVPLDILDLCHVAALRENEERTAAPVAARRVTPTPERRRAQALLDRRADEAEKLRAALRQGMAAIRDTVEALTPVLLRFALQVDVAVAELARLFGVPHPNACALCGDGVGPRDHPHGHDYEPPMDWLLLRRMHLRRAAQAPARERVHEAHRQYRIRVRTQELREQLQRQGSHWTAEAEMERAGLTDVPFDRQGEARSGRLIVPPTQVHAGHAYGLAT